MSKTLEIKFNVTENGGIKTMTVDGKALADVLKQVQGETKKMGETLMNAANKASLFKTARDAVGELHKAMSGLTDAYALQETNEQRLAQVMRNTMNATDDEIESIKAFCSAQQELGVVGDEVQLQDAQELGTYLEQVDTFQTLIPVINDMAAQQLGLGASGESVAQIATMVGKVMQGQTAALSRYGYSFTEAQEQELKFGSEAAENAALRRRVERLEEIVKRLAGEG